MIRLDWKILKSGSKIIRENGKTIASGSHDNSIIIWDYVEGKRL